MTAQRLGRLSPVGFCKVSSTVLPAHFFAPETTTTVPMRCWKSSAVMLVKLLSFCFTLSFNRSFLNNGLAHNLITLQTSFTSHRHPRCSFLLNVLIPSLSFAHAFVLGKMQLAPVSTQSNPCWNGRPLKLPIGRIYSAEEIVRCSSG